MYAPKKERELKLQPSINYISNDVVLTPFPLAKRIIEHFPIAGRVLDPCRGTGAFYEQFNVQDKEWCEISDGRDFFNHYGEYDWIVSNPPYSIFRKFLIHSMEIAHNIVFLITVNHVWTKARIRDMKEHEFGIKEIYCCDTPSNLPPSGFQYGAVWFQKDWDGDITLSFDESPVQDLLL